MFGSLHLTNACQSQTSPHFEGHCDCSHLSRMGDHSPTPPLSKPGSSILAACDQDLNTPPHLSPLSITTHEKPVRHEDSYQYGFGHTFNDTTPYSGELEEDLRQYIAAGDVQPACYDQSTPQYFHYPTYQPTPTSYANYRNSSYSTIVTTPSSFIETPTMDQYLIRSHPLFSQQELSHSFGGVRDESYLTISAEEEDEEEDSLCDKPYARLIYEALMQAPGHRMMLREIYDWFLRHTTKPAESGTNGWQNSIRHNLSMNQAFENDKSDPASGGGQKQKVNSVWVLTENAIRNGVQSTTRYRKTGSGKRMNSNKPPAPLRQRSGAKGGKAARRAAQLRKKENLLHQRPQVSSSLPRVQYPFFNYDDKVYDGGDASDTFSVTDPATPLLDWSCRAEPNFLTSESDMDGRMTSLCASSAGPYLLGPGQIQCDYGDGGISDLTLEEMLRVHQDSMASSISA